MQYCPTSSEVYLQKFGRCIAVLFYLAVCAMLLVGWRLCRAELITAKYGAGHALGIVGTLLMAVLMIYPARKRIPALAVIGSVKMWFRIHMILGILGPVCILFHATFRLGSLNSSVALLSMLAIAVSGIFGRYVYWKIHDGLYGRRITLAEFSDKLRHQRETVESRSEPVPGIKAELLSVAEEALRPCISLSAGIRKLFVLRFRIPFVLRRIKRACRKYLKQETACKTRTRELERRRHRLLILQADLFLEQTLNVAHFNFYERLFALWQVLHIPSSYIMALVVLIHIVAVSLY